MQLRSCGAAKQPRSRSIRHVGQKPRSPGCFAARGANDETLSKVQTVVEARGSQPKPYKFIGFGAMEVTKSHEFIGFGAMKRLILDDSGSKCEMS